MMTMTAENLSTSNHFPVFVERYQELGFSFIPLHRPKPYSEYYDGKRPALDNWTTYMSRHPTDEETRTWFNNRVDVHNIGVVTGEISNLCVIDFDDIRSAAKFKHHANVDENRTMVVETGKGVHFYFRPKSPGRTVTFRMNDKVHHIKRDGGYVVAPPSLHKNGNIYNLVRNTDPLEADIDEVIRLIKYIGGEFSVERTDRPVNWASELWQDTGEGGRNDTAAKLCGLLIAKFPYDPGFIKGCMNAWNQVHCKPALSDSELDNLVEGEIRRYGPR